MAASRYIEIKHTNIGSLKGIRPLPDVDQFLGIQYAKLTNKFARGTLVESYTAPIQATAIG